MVNNREKFEQNIADLKKLYEEKPTIVVREVDSAIKRIQKTENEESNAIFKEIDMRILGTVLISIFILVIGFINPQSFGMYLFGFVFFLAGNLVGYFVDKFGLIFLFSHGVTGICMMVASQIGSIISSPIMEDLPRVQYIYLVFNIVLFVAGVITVVLCNLSKTIRNRKETILIMMSIYAIAFLMVIIFPKIFGYQSTSIF